MDARIIKIVLLIALLLCLLNMPYWYYELFRDLATFGLGYLAYLAFDQKQIFWQLLFGYSAIIINPIEKFYFKKSTWEYIDVIIALIIVVNICFTEKDLINKLRALK